MGCAPPDAVHLVYLGVTRTLLNLWSAAGGIGVALRDLISHHHCSLQKHVPEEFVCKPRSLKEKDRWQATEFWLLFHYTGPAVLQRIPERMHQKFLTLHAAVSILSPRGLCEMYADCRSPSSTLCQGICHTVWRHIGVLQCAPSAAFCSRCLTTGTLDSFSAFPLENNMQAIKKLIRKARCPLSQIYNRMDGWMENFIWSSK